jgi:hypothetical protein
MQNTNARKDLHELSKRFERSKPIQRLSYQFG